MENDKLRDYFRGQQVSLQWLPVLRALALEMSAHAEAKDLRHLFFKIGERFACDTGERFEGIETLAELQDSLNDFWSQTNWGWVDLQETKGCIDITHYAAPLAEAFGDEALSWSVGLLEGYYQNIFMVLGAGDSMQVQAVGESSGGMDIGLRFGRQDQ